LRLPSRGLVIPVADPWAARVGRMVADADAPVVLEAKSGEGVRRALETIASDRRPLIWVDFAIGHSFDEISCGNRLVDAVNRSTGTKLLSRGTPLSTAVRAFERLLDVLGPFVIGVRSGSAREECAWQLASLHRAASILAVVVPTIKRAAVGTGFAALSAEHLRVSTEEACWFASSRLTVSEVRAIVETNAGDYVRVVGAIRTSLGLPPLWPEPLDATISAARDEFGFESRTLAEALMRRKRYLEAFDLMCSDARELIPLYIDTCGEAFFERGQFEHFWTCLSSLSSDELYQESVVRWYYAAAMAVNRHSEVVPMIESYLRDHEAPELRAQYAASSPSRDFLAETTRAVSARETPITLRHHAFALSLAGRHDEASQVLNRALRLADVLGNDQLVVALATDMCIALQRVGAYRDSLWWGEWACAEYSRRDLNEGYRRVTAIAALAFSKILVGDDVGLGKMIGEIEVSAGLAGVPSYEGVLSVVADYSRVTDRLDRAAAFYQLAFESSAFDISALVAVDYVCCLVVMGDGDGAREVGEKAFALSRHASKYQRDCGVLALGIAYKAIDDPRAANALREAVAGLGDGSDAVRHGQACIHLAEVYLSRNEIDRARQLLLTAEAGCCELGDSGWKLLAGTGEEVRRLKQLLTDRPAGAWFHVLGRREVTLFGTQVELTARQLEIVVILAHVPDGMALGPLAVALYGDRAVLSTAKAAVSRLRSTIPLTSRPYQIAVPFRADFLDLMEHLQQGRVRQALSLYRGPLLPDSESPAVVELREHIDESLRQAVLASGDHEAMLELAKRTDDQDLELLEAAASHMPQNDPQWPLLRARIRQIRRDWGSDDDFNR
jgi:tetratricopeptide (TPR) repeat protein